MIETISLCLAYIIASVIVFVTIAIIAILGFLTVCLITWLVDVIKDRFGR